MNNDNEANDANDNGNVLYVGLPETERQELLRLRREVEQETQRLRLEQARLLMEQQRQQLLREQARMLREQQQLVQDDDDAQMIRVARAQQPLQRQAFETHMLERQQQAESVDEGAEEDADMVSLSMVEPNP